MEDVELKKLLASSKPSRKDSLSTLKEVNHKISPTIVVRSQNQAKPIKPNKKDFTNQQEEVHKQRSCFFLPRSLLITAFSETEQEYPNIASIHPTNHRAAK